jgi:hypothetical protein
MSDRIEQIRQELDRLQAELVRLTMDEAAKKAQDMQKDDEGYDIKKGQPRG